MSIRLNGATSGSIEIDVPAVAGTDTAITIPATSGGQFIVSDSAGDVNIDSGTLFVDASADRVGIGTTSPSVLVDCEGSSSSEVALHLNNVEASGANTILTSTGSTYSYADVGSGTSWLTTGGTKVAVGPYTAGSLQFINGDEKARIDSSGRLLVGTSSASSNTPTVQVQGPATGDSSGRLILSRGSSGVGTSVGTYWGSINFENNGSLIAGRISCEVDAGVSSSESPGRLVFSTTADGASSPTNRMSILANGAHKISTTGNYIANSAYHEMYQNNSSHLTTLFTHISATQPYGIQVYWPSATPDNNTNWFMICTDGTTNRFIVYADGDVRNHDNSYGAISDEKLKQDIVDAGSQWDDLKNLRVRKFKFKSDVEAYGDEAKTLIGVVAQEVETVSPGLVKESPDKDAENNDLGTTTKSVSYSVLYMKAVKALQEAMERIETLEAKVAALEGGTTE